MSTRKTATENGFIIFKDQLSLLKLVPNEQLGKAIKDLLENFDSLPNKEDIIYEMFAVNIRRYREQSTKARQDGLRGGNPTLKGRDNPPITAPLNYKTKQENNIQKEKQVKEKVDEEKDMMLIDDNFFIDEDRNPEFKKAIEHAGKEQVDSLWSWLTEHRYGQTISKKWIIQNLMNKPKVFSEKKVGCPAPTITEIANALRRSVA